MGKYKNISKSLNNSSINSFLVKGALGNGLLKMLDMVLTIIIIIFLARYLGSEDYGIYVYAFTIASLIISPLTGIHTFIVRQSSNYVLKERWSLLKGLIISTNIIIFLILFLMSLIIIFFVSDIFFNFEGNKLITFQWALISASVILLIGLSTSFLQGFNMIVKAQYPQILIKILLLFLIVYFSDILSASISMKLHFFAACTVFFISLTFLLYNTPTKTNHAIPEFSNILWFKKSLPLFLVSGLFIINSHVDIVIIGFFAEDSDIGIYRVAAQNAFLVSLPLIVINTVIPAKINTLYESKKIEELQTFVTNSTRIIVLFSTPLAILFVFFGEQLLNSIYGNDYMVGALALSILCIGQLINCMMGAVVTMLNMTGNEKEVIRGLIFTVLVNTFLNFTLVPKYGINGAALGTCISMGLWNIILAIRVYLKIGINSTIFNLRKI